MALTYSDQLARNSKSSGTLSDKTDAGGKRADFEREHLCSLFLTPFYGLLNELPVLLYIIHVDSSVCFLFLFFGDADL